MYRYMNLILLLPLIIGMLLNGVKIIFYNYGSKGLDWPTYLFLTNSALFIIWPIFFFLPPSFIHAIPILVFLALLYASGNLLFYKTLHLVDEEVASAVTSLCSLAGVVFASILYGEHFLVGQWIGAFICVVGAFLICLKDVKKFSTIPPIAILYMVGDIVIWGFATVYYKEALKYVNPVLATATVGLLMMLTAVFVSMYRRQPLNLKIEKPELYSIAGGLVSFAAMVLVILSLNLVGAAITSAAFPLYFIVPFIHEMAIEKVKTPAHRLVGAALIIFGLLIVFFPHMFFMILPK